MIRNKKKWKHNFLVSRTYFTDLIFTLLPAFQKKLERKRRCSFPLPGFYMHSEIRNVKCNKHHRVIGRKSSINWVEISALLYHTCICPQVSVKKVLLKISQNSQENTCVRVSFLMKLQACNFIKKETLAQMFSCEFREITKNTLFIEHLWWLLLDFLFFWSSGFLIEGVNGGGL